MYLMLLINIVNMYENITINNMWTKLFPCTQSEIFSLEDFNLLRNTINNDSYFLDFQMLENM